MRTTNFRILNDSAWEKFKKLAANNHQSANGLMNKLIEDYVKKNKDQLPTDKPFI